MSMRMNHPRGDSRSLARIRFASFVLDLESGQLKRSGQVVKLAALPARLLVYLAANRHRVVSKRELAQQIWGDMAVGEATLHQAIRTTRRAVDDDGRRQAVIETASGVGYRFIAAMSDPAAAPRPQGEIAYVGNRTLLARIDELLHGVVSGRGAVLLLAGEAGIGKSRAARETVRLAAAIGLTVVRGGAGAPLGAPPFWPWVEVFRALESVRPIGELRRDVPHLFGLESSEGEEASDPTRFRHFRLAARALERSAQHGPLVVLLEDLHDVGASTLELLEFVARYSLHARLLIIATYRETELVADAPRVRTLDRLMTLPSVERQSIEPLGDVEVAYLVEQCSGRKLPLERVTSLKRHTAGNPFFAVELARVLPDDRTLRLDSAWEAWVPRGAEQILADRLSQLTVPVRAVLITAAAIGPTFDADVLVAAESSDNTREALRAATASGFVRALQPGAGGYRFAHALVREALYAELQQDAARRSDLHLRIADAIEMLDPGRKAEIAHHLCEAGDRASAERIASAVTHGAEQAARSGDIGGAFELYTRALGALDRADDAPERTRCALLVAGGRLGVRGTEPESASAMLEEAILLARRLELPELFARAVLAYGYNPEMVGVASEELIGLLDEAISALDDTLPALAAQLRSRKAMEVRYTDGPERALSILDRAVEQAHQSGAAYAIARVLEDASFVRWSVADPEAWRTLNREIVMAASEAGDTELEFQGLKGLATASLEVGDRAGFEEALSQCSATAEEYPSPFLLAVVTSLRATRAFLEGRFGDGEADAIEAASSGLDAISGLAAGQLFYHRLELGRVHELEAATRAFVEERPGIGTWRVALARLLVDADRFEEARAELSELGPPDAMPEDRNWMPSVAMLAECAVVLGDRKLGEQVSALLSPYSQLNVVLGNGALYYGNASHFLGMVSALANRTEDADRHFSDALAVHESMQSAPWRLRTRAEQAHLYAQLGEVDQAATLATEVTQSAREIGMVRCAERASSVASSGR